MGDKKTFKVLSAILHDHKRYEAGDTIDLLAEEAKALLAAKAISGEVLGGFASVNALESAVAEQNKWIDDLKLDLETARKANTDLAQENAGLKKRIAELESQVKSIPAAKGKGNK